MSSPARVAAVCGLAGAIAASWPLAALSQPTVAAAAPAPAASRAAPGALPPPPGDADAVETDAPATPQEKPPAKPKANYQLEIDAPSALAALIRDHTLLGRWQFRDDYDPIQFPLFIRQARAEVEQILAAEGYFAPTVRISAEGREVARIAVDRGPRTTVQRVDLELVGEIAAPERRDERQQLLAEWPMPEGSAFRSADWEAAKRRLVDSLRNTGYVRAEIADSRAEVDPQRHSAALTVAVDAGPLMSFGDVEVHGLKLYPRSVVVGLRPFRRGERYRLDRVIEYQNRLRESGYFSTAAVYPDVFALDADRETRLVPIDVTVTEAQPRRVTLGLGYGTDQGYRAQIGYEDRNFLGRAWQLETSLTWDQVAPRTIVNLRSPYDEDGRFWAAGFRLERFDLHNTRSDRTSATLGRGRRIGDAEHLTSLSYQFEQLRVTPAPGVAIDTTNRAVVLGYSWTLRRVDSRFDPTQGYTLTAQVAGAAEALGSDQSFLRLYTRGMRFIPVATEGRFAGGRLILSLEVGAVLARDSAGIPQENLFRAGGSRSIRGYDYLSLGAPVGQAILAGRYLLVGSVEYQHPITELVSAAVFYDRGNATDSLSGFRTFAGYGVGARVRTPLGPIALDLAYGEQIRSWRWHLSVGFVF